jgi:hypothetical protein
VGGVLGGAGGWWAESQGAPAVPASSVLVVDEQLPQRLAVLLEQRGFNAVSEERAFGGKGVPDEDIIRLLRDWGAKIITKNVRDFPEELRIPITGGNATRTAEQMLEQLRSPLRF